MTMTTITEANVEQTALQWLEDLGWAIAYGPDKQAKATQTVLEQAEVLSEGWSLG